MLAQVRKFLQDKEVDHQSLLEISLAEGKSMFAFQTSGSKAVEIYHQLKKALKQSKLPALTPVLLGTEEAFELMMVHLGSTADDEEQVVTATGSFKDAIDSGDKIDCQNWLAGRLERFVCPPGEWPASIKVQLVQEMENIEDDAPMSISNWDQQRRKMVLGERVHIGLLPTENSYEIPLLLRFGGEDDCPRPDEHYAMLKRWCNLYEADVMAIEPNVIECFVQEPPMTREQAMKVAREHYGYCSARVDQGEGELAPYAYELLNRTLWSFWWD